MRPTVLSRARSEVPEVSQVEAAAYAIPTDQPEADGTLAWDRTTMVCVTVRAGGCAGLGWTYAPAACARLVADVLGPRLTGQSAFATSACEQLMRTGIRNTGQIGLAGYALSAVDVALWDLKARLLDVPLADLLGRARSAVPVYGSGGFTTYDAATLEEQLRGWVDEGVRAVKIKIAERGGSNVERDLARVHRARAVVGFGRELFVDANGGYRRKQAMRVGRELESLAVSWFEEPVTSDDKDGLARISAGLDLDVTAGEYAGDVYEFRRLCGVVDCLQVDATRCGGITGWLRAAAIAASHGLDVSGHCAPYLHLAPAAATPNLRHLEWFHDHVRIEQRFLDGTPRLRSGALADPGAPGHGFALKAEDLEPYRVR